MKIVVDSIVNNMDGLISFKCKIGRAIGTWHGNDPVCHREYVVEFDIEDELIVGKNLFSTDNTEYRIFKEGDKIVLIGKIISIYENNTVSIGLCETSLLVDYSGKNLQEGHWVKLFISNLEVYDTNV